MDDFRLRVFITAAKTLNFTKCAEQLFISQPAVSKHIGELESRYKVQLFERSGSRLALTEAGRVMLEHAERIADGYRRLQYEMDLFTDRLGGELRIIDIEGCTIRREFSFCWPEGRSDALAARFVEFARHTA